MKTGLVASEAKELGKNGAIFLAVIAALTALCVVFYFFAANWQSILGWSLGIIDSAWSLLKSVPVWIWIALAILRVGRKIDRGFAALMGKTQ